MQGAAHSNGPQPTRVIRFGEESPKMHQKRGQKLCPHYKLRAMRIDWKRFQSIRSRPHVFAIRIPAGNDMLARPSLPVSRDPDDLNEG